MNVKIISDSTCDLSSELVSRYDIEIVPLSVILGDFTGRDGIEVTPAKIYQHVAECKELPKTSAVNTEEYVRVFRSWREKGYSIVHYCISSEFSSCYQNACAAAQEMDEVYVVDSRNLSSGQGLLVLKGAEMARAGASAKEIYEECTRLTNKVETVVLLSKGEIDSKKVRVEFSLEDMDMSGFQKGATYEQIKAYVLEHTGLKVSSLYISQIKRKCGLDVGQNYNLSKKEDAKVPKCPPEKEAAIRDALKYFQMI